MLVLSRKVEQSVILEGPAGPVEVKVLAVKGGGAQAMVRLGITAPSQVRVWRREVYDEVVAENQKAAATPATLDLGRLAASLQLKKE